MQEGKRSCSEMPACLPSMGERIEPPPVPRRPVMIPTAVPAADKNNFRLIISTPCGKNSTGGSFYTYTVNQADIISFVRIRERSTVSKVVLLISVLNHIDKSVARRVS